MDSTHNGWIESSHAVYATLHFGGAHRWRIDLIDRGYESEDGDFFIRDEEKHVLYKFLSPPILPEVFYHEYDVRDFSPISEAYGLEQWTLFDPQNPCSTFPDATCVRLGSDNIKKLRCDKWRMDTVSGSWRTRLTVWIDRRSGITVKSDIENVSREKKHREVHRVILQLTNIQQAPQGPALFESVGIDGRITSPNGGDLRAGSGAFTIRKDVDLYTFQAAAKEVLVDATVRDGKHRLVPNLQKSDFRVFADGVEQPVIGFWYDEVPLAVALVVDNSQSMQPALAAAHKTAAEVLSQLKPNDKVAVFALNTRADIVSELTSDRSHLPEAIKSIGVVSSPQELLPWVEVPQWGNGTDIVNALFVATLYLRDHAPEMRRVVILISDNQATAMTITRKQVVKDENDLIDTALLSETVIYDLQANGGLPRGPEIAMDHVTEVTGGEMMKASGPRLALDEVIDALRKRYLLSFKPAQTDPDGRLHTIELRLADRLGRRAEDYSIYYRKGYRTPQLQSQPKAAAAVEVAGIRPEFNRAKLGPRVCVAELKGFSSDIVGNADTREVATELSGLKTHGGTPIDAIDIGKRTTAELSQAVEAERCDYTLSLWRYIPEHVDLRTHRPPGLIQDQNTTLTFELRRRDSKKPIAKGTTTKQDGNRYQHSQIPNGARPRTPPFPYGDFAAQIASKIL